MKRGIMITCEDASHYIIRKETEELKMWDRVRLFMHLAMCKFCKLFEKQNKIINSGLKKIEEVQKTHFKDEAKEQMLQRIQK